jgi:hypothetical protein
MDGTNDMVMWWPPIEFDVDAAIANTEDVLEDLTEPAIGVDSLGTEKMEATDYALPPE